MKFSYEDAQEICELLLRYQNKQISCINKFQNDVIEIAEKTNYKKIINALAGMIQIYNSEICEKLHGELLERWHEGESLIQYGNDMMVGADSDEIAEKIENVLNELFYENINLLAEYKYNDVAAAGEESFEQVLNYINVLEQDIESVSNEYINIFKSEAEDNELYHLLLPYIEAISAAFNSFVLEGKKQFENLSESFLDAMHLQLAKTTERTEEAIGDNPFEELDIYVGSNQFGSGLMFYNNTSSGSASVNSISVQSHNVAGNSGSDESFTDEEIEAIKNDVSLAYEKGEKIANEISEFNSYKEHHLLKDGHIEKVHKKSLEAAKCLEKLFNENTYGDLYSGYINKKALEMMALYHDTGMDGNYDVKSYLKAKEQKIQDIQNGEKVEEFDKLKKKHEEMSEKEVLTNFLESDILSIRKNHSLNSAIHVLRDRDKIKAKGVSPELVALGCFAHSKSNSEIKNLADESQWVEAVKKIKSKVDEWNVEHQQENISFDEKFFIYKDEKTKTDKFKPDILKEIRSESLCLRIGDANGHDSKSKISQNGKDIVFSLDDYKNSKELMVKDGYLKDGYIPYGYSSYIKEVGYAKVSVGGIKLNKDNDESGASRMFAVGEGNFKSLELSWKNGKPVQKFKLENGNAFPLCTQNCIYERLMEFNTAKIKEDDNDKDITPKIDFKAVIELGNVDKPVLESYQEFVYDIKSEYNIDIELK